jgi:ABC-type branched-subunit amino acid transport system ATPase component
MGYRFHSRQKTYSIGPYGNGKDGTFSLADARRERDKAKVLLKEGKDLSFEKQFDKHRQAAARPFERNHPNAQNHTSAASRNNFFSSLLDALSLADID